MSKDVLITQIQRFAVNDGPGFRTNVFLKGCSLRCKWCHNPETQSLSAELYWRRRLCVQCGACLDACPQDAINPPISPEEAQTEGSTYHKIILERCDMCMKCVDACKYGALEIAGTPMSVDEVLDEVDQDRPFYDNSGGGMTISGGEPLVHLEFVNSLLDGAKARGLHVCLDTSGFCPWSDLEGLAKKSDIILYDLKHLDSSEHERMTGVSNKLILENLSKLLENGFEVWLRIVVIPEYSDSFEYHERVAKYLAGLPGRLVRIDLLPYHDWCQDKYNWLGRKWQMDAYEAIDPAEVDPLMDPYEDEGLNVTLGGSGFENKE